MSASPSFVTGFYAKLLILLVTLDWFEFVWATFNFNSDIINQTAKLVKLSNFRAITFLLVVQYLSWDRVHIRFISNFSSPLLLVFNVKNLGWGQNLKNWKVKELFFFFAYNFSRFQYAPATYPTIYYLDVFFSSFQNNFTYTCAILHPLLSFSHVLLFVIPWTVACQTPLSIGFSRQEYWGGLLFPTPGDLPNPRIEPASFKSPALPTGFFTTCDTLEAPLLFRWANYPINVSCHGFLLPT